MSASDNFHHVRDLDVFELPWGYEIHLPEYYLGPLGYVQVTKFMVLQVIAALLVFVIFGGLSSKVRSGKPVSGRFWNFWEMIALFIRDEIVRPTIGDGHHDHDDDHHGHSEVDEAAHATHPTAFGNDGHFADKYLPFVWSCFFYVLFCNLLGAIPFMGSATGNLNVTGVLALCSIGATFIYGAQAMGVQGFFGNLVPDTGMTGVGGMAMGVGMFVIELMGFVIKHCILALRLFGNIMGGHTALGVLLGFIAVASTQGPALWGAVTVGSVLGQVGIGILELLVAVLQAYVFSFLATIFISGAIHKH